MRRAHALSLLTLALLPAVARGGKEDLYAITGAKVVTVSGPTLENGTVVMRDGVIVA